MSLTYTKEKKEIKLDDAKSTELKSSIVNMYDAFYEDLQPHISDYEKLKLHLYGILRNKDKDKFLMTKIYEQSETYIAQLKNKCAGSVETLFGIEGNSQVDQDNSNTMKAFVEDKLEKMEYLTEYDTGIPNYVQKGAFYTFTEWVKNIREVKRLAKVDILTGEEATDETLPENITEGRITKIETVYDGAKSVSINPFSIVFDKNKVKDWDKCPKIYKTWLSPEEILARKDYKISKETQDKLKEIGKKNNNGSITSNSNTTLSDDATNGDMIEVLEYWGDLRLPDGTFLENWLAVVVGRLEVVRFCKNPFLINPFTRCSFMDHPDTGREISPLLVAVVNNEKKSEVFRAIEKGMAFANNPCHITNGKMGLEGENKAEPGKIIEAKNDGLNPNNPIIYSIDGKGLSVNFEVMPMFDAEIEQSTGINKYLTGNVDGAKVDFATEASGIMGGGEVRIQKDVDNINRKLTKPTIQKIADLNANMISQPQQIKIRNNGKVEFKEVTPDVVQGSYEFKVADAKQQTANKQKAQITVNVLEKIAQGNKNANVDEISKFALENICDVKDTSKFFIEDGLQKAINEVPEEQREQAKQFLTEVLQNPQKYQPQAPQQPTANQFVLDIAAKTICDDNRYPDDVKQAMLQMLQLQPSQEYLVKLQGKNNAPIS